MIDFKDILESIARKISISNAFLLSVTFFLLISHNVFTDIGLVRYNISTLPVLLDTFGENIIDKFLSRSSIFTFFASLIIVITLKHLNNSIFVVISTLSKYSINNLYNDCKERIIRLSLSEKDGSLRRTTKRYWVKKIKIYLNFSTLMLILMLLSSIAWLDDYLSFWLIPSFLTMYLFLYGCIFVLINRYYIFCLALDSVRNSTDFIASKQIRELIE